MQSFHFYIKNTNKLISHIHSFNFPIFAKVCLNIFEGVQNFIIEAKHALKAIGKGIARKKNIITIKQIKIKQEKKIILKNSNHLTFPNLWN